jgi:hypothetical protein
MAKRKPVKIETTVGDAVNTAFGVIEELAGEMREAYNNTPESLQQSGVGEARGEAAGTLENISEPDVPEALQHLPVVFEQLPMLRSASRADRLADGLESASQAIEALNAHAEVLKLNPSADEEGMARAALLEELEATVTEIQDMIDEAEGVSFPGMFG